MNTKLSRGNRKGVVKKMDKNYGEMKAEALKEALVRASDGNMARFKSGSRYVTKAGSDDPKVILEAIRIAADGNAKLRTEALEIYNRFIDKEKKSAEQAEKSKDDKKEEPTTVPAESEKSESIPADEVKVEEPAVEVPELTEAEQLEEQSEADEKARKKRIRNWILAVAAVVLFVIVLAVVHNNTNVEAQKTAVTPVTGENVMFLQVAGANEKNRVDSDFAAKYAAATKDASNLSAAQEKLLLKNSANNAQRLAIWSNAFGLYDDPNNITPLLSSDKKYLSDKGQDLYYQLKGALRTCTLSEGQVPANYTNTGVSSESKSFVVAAKSGISGDRTSIVAEKPTGEKVYIMLRCANTPIPANVTPSVPTGPTDEPDWLHVTKLEPKRPTDDVLANPKVADWKKNSDDQPLMTIDSRDTTDNGDKVANGLQVDPTADAEKAEKAADKAADQAVDAANNARDTAEASGAGKVDDNKHLTEVDNPTDTDPNW